MAEKSIKELLKLLPENIKVNNLMDIVKSIESILPYAIKSTEVIVYKLFIVFENKIKWND